MSGGHFDYYQFHIMDIRDELKRIINNNNKKNEFGSSYDFPDEIIDKFKEAVIMLSECGDFVHEIDYLICGDNGEQTFLRRWEEIKDRYGRG